MLTVFIANWIAETWRYCPLSIQPISIYLIELASCVQAMPVAEYQQAGRGRRGRKMVPHRLARIYIFNVLASEAGSRRQ